MKKWIFPIILILSLISNMILLGRWLISRTEENTSVDKKPQFENEQYRITTAKNLIRQTIVNDLYFPESYDAVSISVDSVFHGPLTDSECLKAATELIRLYSELPNAENSYKEAVHTLKIFGSSGVFWRHAEEKKNAENRLNSIKSKIAKREEIIKQRDTSNDGYFIGWIVVHRYRAKTRGANISISDVAYIINPEMTDWMFKYSLDKSDPENLSELDKVIRQTLGTYQEE